jgi:hypothetical protein
MLEMLLEKQARDEVNDGDDIGFVVTGVPRRTSIAYPVISG